MVGFFIGMAVLGVFGKIVFAIAGEAHESKAFWIMLAIGMIVLGFVIFSGDSGGPTGGQFDHLRAK